MSARVDLFKRTLPTLHLTGKRVIAGGRLIPKKGLHQLAGVKNLTIFGDGPLKQELEQKLPDAEFVGWLDGEGLRDLMEDSWLFLNPSVVTNDGDREGIPNTIKESLLMNLNCISTSVGGISELDSVDILNDWSRINSVIENTTRAPNKKGRLEILNTYSPKSCVDRLLEAIGKYG